MIGPVELVMVIVALAALARTAQFGRGGTILLVGVLGVAMFGWMRMRWGVGVLSPPRQPAHFDGGRMAFFPILLLMAGGVALFASRRHGRSVLGLLAFGAICGLLTFLVLGSVVTYRRVEMSPPHVAMSVPGPHGEVHVDMPAEPPLDELWERLNESRIQLSSAAEQATQQAIAAAAAGSQAAAEEHKAATAGRAAEDSDPSDPVTEEPPTEELVDEPVTEEPVVEETAAEAPAVDDEVAEASSHEEPVDEAADERVEESTSETAEEPQAHDADFTESSEPPSAADPAVEAPVEPTAPPVEPAQPAAEPFADPFGGNRDPQPDARANRAWREPFADPFGGDSAEPFAPATPVAVAALPDPEPEPRPDWVGAPPKVVENIYRVPVQAGPYVTLRECYDQLRNEMRTVVQQRVEELVRESTGARHVHIPDLDWMHVGASYIDRELLTDEYVEINDTSVGTMRTAWGLLEFTPNHDRHLVDSWKRAARQSRMAMVATMAALVVGALGGVLLLLKIDTWTRGYYTKRLFLGVPAAIIALIALIAIGEL